MNDTMRTEVIERAARHGVLLDKDDPALLFADIAMLIADKRAEEITENFKRDIQPAKDLLDKFAGLESVIGNENEGLVKLIQESIIVMEDAIADLGGAYEVETEASKIMVETAGSLKETGKHILRDVETGVEALSEKVSNKVNASLETEADRMIEKLAALLREKVLNDVADESVSQVLGERVDEASKAALARRVIELESREQIYKESANEVSYWRKKTQWMLPLLAIGLVSLGALALGLTLIVNDVVAIAF